MKRLAPLLALVWLTSCTDSKGSEGNGVGGSSSSSMAGDGSGEEPSAGGASAGRPSGGTDNRGGSPITAGGKPTGGDVSTGGSTGGNPGGAGAAGAAQSGARWLGRVEETSKGARFAWPGTGFVARFQGTGLVATLKTEAEADYFQVVIDDDDERVLTTTAGERAYDLARGLPAGEHLVTLWRRTETVTGLVEVTGIDIVAGEWLPPPPAMRRLEVVGDSITVGFGVDCGPDDGFSYATENNYLTYEAVAARALGADVTTLAWTGIGMSRDDDGQTQTQMPDRYLRTIASEANSRWSFDQAIPDAVVIALGTNDFATGDPGQPFLDAYAKFLDDMRGRYPNARIYLAGSPMIEHDGLLDYLSQLEAARNAKGDQNVSIIDFAPPDDDGWGCGHPNGSTHAVMATKLESALKTDLGW